MKNEQLKVDFDSIENFLETAELLPILDIEDEEIAVFSALTEHRT